MDTFTCFKTAGKIIQGGVSNFDVGQMTECLKNFPIVTNQVGYHLFDNRPEEEVAKLALAWVIANPVVSVALAGTRRASEIEQNVEAADWDMAKDERELIRSIATEN